MNLADLHFQVVRPGRPDQQAWPLNAAFDHWNRVWTKTLSDLDGLSDLRSDDFTKQDEIFCLFEKDRCVALICHRQVDLSFACHRRDSYFRVWPDEAVAALTEKGSRVLIGSQISVEPDWRGKIDGFGLKEILTVISLQSLFSRGGIDAITGTMRVDRGMHHLFYEFGALPLCKAVPFHGVTVDLVAFFPERQPLKVPAQLQHLAAAIPGTARVMNEKIQPVRKTA